MMSNCNCNWGGCIYSKIGNVLLVIGGLNWGLMGVAILMGSASDWNIVRMLLGSLPTLEAIVYVLVGLAAIMKLFGCKCKKCKAACASCETCKVEGGEQKM